MMNAGQLVIGGYLGEEPTDSLLKALRKGERGGAILFKRNLPSIDAAHSACTAIASASSDVPPWICVDQEGGRVSRLPPPFLRIPAMLKLGATGSDALLERCGAVVGAQLRALGFNLNLAPVLDVHTNPDNPVIGDRACSSEPHEAARLALSYLRGLRAAGVVGCGKHFPGHGDTSVDSHLGLPTVHTPLERLEAVELVPFVAAIREGLECLMSAHIVCDALDASSPATLSRAIATELLRDRLGFQGVLLSDDLEMKAIAAHQGVAEAAVEAIRAGCDAVLICSREDWQQEAFEALVREQEASPAFRARCQQAADRCLALRRRNRPAPARTVQQALAVLQSEQARQLAAELGV
jgi:beta-N-acetylhexosaminidase